MSASPFTAVKVNAGNDANGNPRRGWIILETRDGYPVVDRFVDEGYLGARAVTAAGYPRELADAPELEIAGREYRKLKARHGAA
jgi:hypothetical protein